VRAVHTGLDHEVVVPAKDRQGIELDPAQVAERLANALVAAG
jgi:hypothetical protein